MSQLRCRKVLPLLVMALFCGCSREPAAQHPAGAGSSDGYGPGSLTPGSTAPRGILVETPITATSRLVFAGHEWKRDPTGSTIGSEDLPEMGDDGIEDSFTTYLTDDPNLRLFYMLTGEGHRIYVRERDKNRWITMQRLFIQE